jgi:GTP-binding protein
MNTYPKADLLLSAAHASHFPPDQGAEVAFAGRSNAGKSSAINAITGRRSLARTSKTPGRTRLLNFFELTPGCRIVDLPGYGYAPASPGERASWESMTSALSQRAALHGLFLVIDSRRGVQPTDDELIAWAAAADRPVHVLLSKADKLKRAELGRTLSAAQQGLAGRATVQAFSAVDGSGLEQARGQLNQWLKKNSPGGRTWGE